MCLPVSLFVSLCHCVTVCHWEWCGSRRACPTPRYISVSVAIVKMCVPKWECSVKLLTGYMHFTLGQRTTLLVLLFGFDAIMVFNFSLISWILHTCQYTCTTAHKWIHTLLVYGAKEITKHKEFSFSFLTNTKKCIFSLNQHKLLCVYDCIV